jgi:RNA polymerase sigma-70 factor, ECF subfamily
VVFRLVDNAEDTADVVQDTFISAFQNLASFKGDAELFTWLYRIAFNNAMTLKRKKRPTISLDAQRNGELGEHHYNPFTPEDTSVDVRPGSAIERTEDEIAVAAAIQKLSDEHRAVLVLKDIDGLKYEEIAEVVGVPIGTVRSRLNRARLELRGLLDPNGEMGNAKPTE